MMSVSDTTDTIDILRLHTDNDGCIWYGDDDTQGINTYLEVNDFLNSSVLNYSLDDVKCIRLLGSRLNAQLIVELQRRRASNPNLNDYQRIQLCSPAIIFTESLRQSPLHILQQLWQPSYPSSISGNWHDMENIDLPSYLMINEMQDSIMVPEIVHRIAPYHPAWPAIAYLKEFDLDSACRLLMEIIDPRWYRHPMKPNRRTKLYAYLGLTPDNIYAYLGEGLPGRYYNRAVLAISVWYNVTSINGNFLWRHFDKQETKIKGLLYSTRLFISFLQAMWLSVFIHVHPEMLSYGSLFFKDEIEAKAFECFKATWKATRHG